MLDPWALRVPWAGWALRVPNAGSMSTEGAQCWIREPLGYPRCHVLGVCNCRRKYWDGYCLVNICCVFSWQKWQRKWFCLYANGDLYYYDTEKVNLCCLISLFGTHHTSLGRHECLVLFLFTPWNWLGGNTNGAHLICPISAVFPQKLTGKEGENSTKLSRWQERRVKIVQNCPEDRKGGWK